MRWDLMFPILELWSFCTCGRTRGGATLVERESFMYPELLVVKIFYLPNKVQDHRDKSLHTKG